MYFILLQENINQYVTQSAQPVVNQQAIKFKIPPLETQRQVVEKLDWQMQALEGVQLLKEEAQKRIEKILAKAWGE